MLFFYAPARVDSYLLVAPDAILEGSASAVDDEDVATRPSKPKRAWWRYSVMVQLDPVGHR